MQYVMLVKSIALYWKDVYRRPRQVQYLNQLEICHLENAIVKFFEYPCETPVKYK